MKSMITIIKRTKIVLLVDTVLFLVAHLPFNIVPIVASTGWEQIHSLASFALVAAFVYYANKEAPNVRSGMIYGLVFWFIWRPLLFVASVVVAAVYGSQNMERLPESALGVLVGLVLLSPLVLLIAALTSVLAKKYGR